MVSSFKHLSPTGQAAGRQASIEVNAMLAAKRAAKEVAQRMSLPGEMPPPSPMGFGPPSPPMAAPVPAPSMMAGFGAPPMQAAPPSIPDPAMDPSIPPPTIPAPEPQRFAEGGVVGAASEPPPPFAPTVEQIMATALKLKRGEPVSIADLGQTDGQAGTPTPRTGPESAVTPREPLDPSQTPANLPPPPERFLVWLERSEPTSGIGVEIRAAYEDDPASAPALWELVQQFVKAPDDDEQDDLPPDLLAVVSGRTAAPAQRMRAPFSLPKDRKVALPV